MKKAYGFESANNGMLEVIPKQAAIVQEIYRQYLFGKSLGGIADFLFEENVPSPSGKERWSKSVLDKMLSNTKYINTVISFEEYFAVQNEKSKRSSIDEDTHKRKATQYYSKDVLSGLFVCAECGGVYWRIRPSGEIVWRCSNRVKHGKDICQHSPSLPESELKQAVCEMLEISEFDPEAVKENLECVQVLSDGTLAPEFVQRISGT
ncbi:MAG: recombinase family protein [Peptococcaceae bacterium]|nr:recombinase family protein [Peptococcaceae bacterium]